MERIIRSGLMIIGIMAWAARKGIMLRAIKRYGLTAVITGKLARHAAIGRAKHQWFWNIPCRNHRNLEMSATELINRLRAERNASTYGLAS